MMAYQRAGQVAVDYCGNVIYGLYDSICIFGAGRFKQRQFNLQWISRRLFSRLLRVSWTQSSINHNLFVWVCVIAGQTSMGLDGGEQRGTKRTDFRSRIRRAAGAKHISEPRRRDKTTRETPRTNAWDTTAHSETWESSGKRRGQS